jgi:prepilin-type N-terminal cleavage/methylation domain-containing protein
MQNRPSALSQPFSSRRGFTLTEIMIAGSIGVVVASAAMMLIVDGTRISLRTLAGSNNDMVQWSISNRLQLDSKVANGASIYADLTTAAVVNEGSRIRSNEESTDPLEAGRGKLLILSTSRNDFGQKKATYLKLIGYRFIDSTVPANRQLLRFDYTVSDADQTARTPLETIIRNNIGSFTMRVIASNLESLDPVGPFVCRDATNRNAATATFRLSQGVVSNRTSDKILIEVSFLIRR